MEALQRLHNRGSISTGYDIENSLKFETANNEWLIRNSPTAGNRKTHTFSFWVKRTALGTINASGSQGIIGQGQHGRMFFGSDYFQYRFDDGHDVRDITTLFRDTAAWYHIVVAVDTNQSTSSNRVKIYYNGVQTTTIDHDGGSYPDIQDSASSWFNTNNITIGTLPFGASYTAGDGDYDMSGYLADFAAVDGTQYAPTDFGEFDEDTGIWKPKDLSDITWGSEGYYLKFDDSSNLGADSSGNGNNFTLNNITAADQATDTPTNNFAILSQSMQGYYEDLWSVISEGGTKFRCTEFDAWITTVSSIGVTKGKWYAEFKITGARPNNMFGIASMEQLDNNSGYIYGGRLGESGESWGIGYYQANGNLMQQQNSGYTLISGWGSSISQLATVGIAVDMDNHNLYLAVNNTYQNSGDPTSGATGTGAISFDATETVAIATTGYSLGSGNDTIVEGNFGGFSATSTGFTNTDANGYGTFKYAPPSGYYALCTKNLEEFG
jgi:hypothetical protein